MAGATGKRTFGTGLLRIEPIVAATTRTPSASSARSSANTRSRSHGGFYGYTRDIVADLDRLFHTLDGKPAPSHLADAANIVNRASYARKAIFQGDAIDMTHCTIEIRSQLRYPSPVIANRRFAPEYAALFS
jgi:hypothetical protein